MLNKKSPLSIVKEKFGSKEALVEALLGFPQKLHGSDDSKDKDAQRKTFLHAANSKLLVLHKTFQAVQTQFGSKEKMVEKLLSLMGRIKDEDFRKKLYTKSLGQLLDKVSSLSKKVRQASKSA